MTTYARIDDDAVAEIYTPPGEFDNLPIEEQFHPDLTWVDLTGVSPTPEVGWSYDGTAFAPPPPPEPLTIKQQGEMLLRQPVTVHCTSIPALNADYWVDPATQAQITSVAASIAASLGLPGGGSTFNWSDVTGTAHAWPAPQFTDLAKAVMNFVYAAGQVAQGHSTTLPSSTLTIA